METKYCSGCTSVLPIAAFCKNKAQKDGLSNYCRSCRKRVVAKRAEASKEIVWDLSVLKVCSQCGVEHPLSEYYFNYNYPVSMCKYCAAIKRKAHYTRNRERILATVKAYVAANKELIMIRRGARYEANRGKILEKKREYTHRPEVRKHRQGYNQKYRQENLEYLQDYDKRYKKQHYVENKEYYLTKSRNRRGLLLGSVGTHTHEELQYILRIQDFCCVYCGCNIAEGYTVDHYVPLSAGGQNDVSNLQLLCSYCNKSKGPKMPEEYEALIMFNRSDYCARIGTTLPLVLACVDKN
mgnify:CR=1 FL=1